MQPTGSSRPAGGPEFTPRDLALTALFAALTAVLAQVSIPIPHVPITGQTFGVMLAGALLGSRLGALSQIVYVLMGVAGLPVFARGAAGPAVLLGPTGGYLAGFVVGAFIVGWIVEREGARTSLGRALVANALGGVAAVYALGVPWLMHVLGMDWQQAAVVGALRFLPGDAVKVLAGAALTVRLLRAIPAGQLPSQRRSGAAVGVGARLR